MGGILKTKDTNSNLDSFLKTINQQLHQQGIRQAIIHQPPNYYTGFVKNDELINLGWKPTGFEWTQFVDLREQIVLHPMQLRHLRKNQAFSIQQVDHNLVGRVHDFIARCRQSQGLEINISLDKLSALIEAFPSCFDLHAAFSENQMISAVVMVKPTKNVCYYYLPATDPQFTKNSPMVHLLHHLYGHYRDLGFHFMDLGVSSIHGVKQAGLFDFKQRMGAKTVKRWSLQKQII